MDDLLTLGSRHIVGCEAHLPLTHVQVCFETSPVCDPPGLEGLTCLTNRLLLEGTVQRTRHDFHAQVEILGTEVISATQASWVSLGGTILSIHRDRFMDLLTEAMTQPRFHLDDLERIRREMMSEIELLGDEDGYLARYWLKNAVFQNTPLLNHPLGRKDTLANIAISDVHQRHCETYTQSRLWLGLSTNMATAEAGQLCRDWATRLPLGTPFTQPTIRPQAWKARNVLLVNKPARSQAQLMIGHAIDHLEIEDKWHLKIAIDAFGGAFSSRLVQALRVQRSLCYDPYAYLSTDRLGGLFLMGASTDGTRLTEAIEVMLNEFEGFRTGGLLADEIELARLARLNSFPFTIETSTLEVSQRLRGRLQGLREGWLEDYLTVLESMAQSDVNRCVHRCLRPESVWVVAVCTVTDALIDACRALPGVDTVRVVSHEDRL